MTYLNQRFLVVQKLMLPCQQIKFKREVVKNQYCNIVWIISYGKLDMVTMDIDHLQIEISAKLMSWTMDYGLSVRQTPFATQEMDCKEVMWLQ